jgi:hypothetical protein
MSHESELTAIHELDALHDKATTSNDPADWSAYDTARRALAARLGLDCPGAVGAATAEGRAAWQR